MRKVVSGKMLFSFLAAIAMNIFCGTTSNATEVSFAFSGNVSPFPTPSSTYYGETILPGAEFSGHFAYDLNSAATGVFPGTTRYLQSRVGGFALNIGGVSVVADEYDVGVTNDSPASTDKLLVDFLGPDRPNASLRVNGVAQPQGVGILHVGLSFPIASFGDTSLPLNLPNPQSGFFPESFISDSGPTPDIFLNVTEVLLTELPPEPSSQIGAPEPSASSLALIGILFHTAFRWRRICKRKTVS